MNIYKMGLVSTLMLALVGGSASAADLYDRDYRGSIKDDMGYMDDSSHRWYWRGDIGFGFNSDPSFTDSNAAKFILDDADENWSIGGGLGIYIMRGFRMDATLDYRMDTDLFSQLDSGTVPTNQFTGELDTLVGLVNFYYDLDLGHRITPYVGVGVGFAHHSIDGDDTDDEDTSFAWALMAGVDIDLRDRWKLDIGYRYLDMGDGSFGDRKTPGRKFEIDDIESHELRVGLRYSFSCWRSCESDEYVSYK